jgi:hypothetical protein
VVAKGEIGGFTVVQASFLAPETPWDGYKQASIHKEVVRWTVFVPRASLVLGAGLACTLLISN